MARIRTIKPAFFQSITLAGLSLAAERHFAGLFTYADDEGRGQDEARLLKAALWPLRDEMTTPKVERLMVELAEASLITRYSVEGRCFFEINGWGEHQRINRPTPSKFPSCTEPSMTAHWGKGKERKGKEQGRPLSRPSSLSSGRRTPRRSPRERRSGRGRKRENTPLQSLPTLLGASGASRNSSRIPRPTSTRSDGLTSPRLSPSPCRKPTSTRLLGARLT